MPKSTRESVIGGKSSAVSLIVLALGGLAMLSGSSRAEDTEPESASPLLRFRLPDGREVRHMQIVSVGDDGTARLVPAADVPFEQQELTEGYYLGLVVTAGESPSPDVRELLRVKITEIADDATAVARVGPQAIERLQSRVRAAERLEVSLRAMLIRPQGSSTAQLRAVPDVALLQQFDPDHEPQRPHRAQSETNLRQIAIALHNFHDAYGYFPPAVIRGPDGEPWHSWRVLILPYLEETDLFDQYRFDEPWDGPNNKRLLERIPSVYQDPVYGDTVEPYTHYAVIAGPEGDDVPPHLQTTFPGKGVQITDLENGVGGALREGQSDSRSSLTDLSDGTMNTILAGTIDPERRIPWMKPEDVVFQEGFPPPGAGDGFAAPHREGSEAAGLFVFADASVRAISVTVDPEVFRAMMTRAGGEQVRRELAAPRRGRPVVFLEIAETDQGPTAWFREEWIEEGLHR